MVFSSLLLKTRGQPFTIAAARAFSTTAFRSANRAIIYQKPGDPTSVLSTLTYPNLPPPLTQHINIRFLLAPINPADINVIEGVYPNKPAQDTSLGTEQPVFVAGNEGLAEVTDVGSGVSGVKKGDRVLMATQQLGTWTSARTVLVDDVVKVPADVSEITAATMTVNPPTAYNMIHDFVDLNEGDWLMQNGANSAVGQAVIQIAARKGIKTLNFVRARDDLDALKQRLTELGATKVLTYDELSDKALRVQVKEWTGGKPIRLMLNCVSGPDTTAMTRFLGEDANIVSYGAMSKQPLSVPTTMFIFKNLKCHGFWQSNWYKQHGREEREAMLKTIVSMQLEEPVHEILTILAQDSDEVATEKVRTAVRNLTVGLYGKKVLLKVESPAD